MVNREREREGSEMTNQFGGAVDALLIRAQPGERSVALQAGGEPGVGGRLGRG